MSPGKYLLVEDYMSNKVEDYLYIGVEDYLFIKVEDFLTISVEDQMPIWVEDYLASLGRYRGAFAPNKVYGKMRIFRSIVCSHCKNLLMNK